SPPRAPRRASPHRSWSRETRSPRRVSSSGPSLHGQVVVLGDRVREQPITHRPRAHQRFIARRRLHLEHQMLAHPHPGDLAEAQGVQSVLHRLALRVEQGGPRHHAHLDLERAHPWPPPSRSRGAIPRGGPNTSATAPLSAITIGPAMSVSSSSSSKKKPSSVARRIPYKM